MHTSMLIFYFSLCLFSSTFADSNEITDESERHALRCLADDLEPWSYRGDNGPMYWGEIYDECHGRSQSPIFIDSGRVENRRLSRLWLYYYNVITNPIVRNNGYSVELIADNVWRAIYTNGSSYQLREIHFHWGSTDAVGSEHVVDGVRYPMEMHLIHTNSNNGTVVVAVFFEAVDEINAELQHIVNVLPKIMYKDTEIRMRYRFDAMNILPENPASYFQYDGSLTTPECTEGVIWIVLKTPNHVGRSQLQEFRKLFSSPQNMTETGCKISNNFRPVQHLHRRRVWASV